MNANITKTVKRRHVVGGDDVVWVDHGGVLEDRPKAKRFRVHGNPVWVPKSVIVDEGAEQLGVAKWWADKNGIQGDW